ncbi:MAG: Guanine/hypoxanthine permease PbuG [Spirochaetes bacterium ADurb.Bin315]|nr:MAG: Guanine/hypoxanthine permease PbuG [Spirochaetes bacterium ADurb.Bin315]
MDKFFKITERKSTVKTEVIAGITTFLTMAYILVVNPGILSATGMSFEKVFSATAISSAIATLIMALMANLPFALAPGMGLNAFFAFSVVLGMGYSWQFALTAVFVEGIIFIILTFVNIREAIVNSIPANLKKAIGVGIGLFIAFIGLQNAGIIVNNDATLVALNPGWFKGGPGLAMLGLLITGVLLAFKVRGALLIGIIITTIIGIPFGITQYAGGKYVPPAPYFFQFEFSKAIFSLDFVVVMFTFLFVDMFDTVGTLIGCATKADMIQKDGSIPNVKEALFADAVVTTAILFLLSLFLVPLFSSIPSVATAPALIIVGVFMITPVVNIDWDDMTEAIPAFLTLLFMIVAYSIAEGIMFGIISYVLLKLFSKKGKEIGGMTWVVFALFVAKIFFGALGS